MAYTAAIDGDNPSLFLFLIDQSGSMNEILNPTNIRPAEVPFPNDGKTCTQFGDGPTKAQLVADAINRHQGTVFAANAPDGGAIVGFDLPEP